MLVVLAAISKAFVDILPAFSAIAVAFNSSASVARVTSAAIAVAFTPSANIALSFSAVIAVAFSCSAAAARAASSVRSEALTS